MPKLSSQSNRPSNRSPQRTAVSHLASPTLTVWIYDSAMGGAAGEVRLKDLKGRNALQVPNAVTVSWMPGAHQPRIGHLRRETSAAAARGSVLGGLVRLTLLPPSTGEAAGAGIVASAQRLRGTGIDQTFLEETKAQLRPETSALLVLSGHADLDEVRPVIERDLARGDVALMQARFPTTLQKSCVRRCTSSRVTVTKGNYSGDPGWAQSVECRPWVAGPQAQ